MRDRAGALGLSWAHAGAVPRRDGPHVRRRDRDGRARAATHEERARRRRCFRAAPLACFPGCAQPPWEEHLTEPLQITVRAIVADRHTALKFRTRPRSYRTRPAAAAPPQARRRNAPPIPGGTPRPRVSSAIQIRSTSAEIAVAALRILTLASVLDVRRLRIPRQTRHSTTQSIPDPICSGNIVAIVAINNGQRRYDIEGHVAANVRASSGNTSASKARNAVAAQAATQDTHNDVARPARTDMLTSSPIRELTADITMTYQISGSILVVRM